MKESENTLPFHQQPKESTKAFAAFSLYLSLGEQRSLELVATKLQKSMAIIGRWSGRWRWGERVDAYVQHMARVEQEATEALLREKSVEWTKRQEEQRQSEWKARCELVELANRLLARWRDSDKCGTLEGVARILELASKLGRLATNMPTDKTEITGEDGGPIRVELEAALRKVYGEVVDVDAIPVPAALPDKT